MISRSILLKWILVFLTQNFGCIVESINKRLTLLNYSTDCTLTNWNLTSCTIVYLKSCNENLISKSEHCYMFHKNSTCRDLLQNKRHLIQIDNDHNSCNQDSDKVIKTSNALYEEYINKCSDRSPCILNLMDYNTNQQSGLYPDTDNNILSRNSVLFVAVSFILLMVISLAWLVFYYVQRFRYIHSKERVSRCLADLAKKAVARIPVKTLKPGDKEVGPEIDQCAICIETYRPLDNIRILPCRHFFHKQCIDPWLLEQRSCPMCKLDILHAYGLRPELSGCGSNNPNNNSNNTIQNSANISSSQLQQQQQAPSSGVTSVNNNNNIAPSGANAILHHHGQQTIQIISGSGNGGSQRHHHHSIHHHGHHLHGNTNKSQAAQLLHHQTSFTQNAQLISGQSTGSPHSSSLPSLNAILDYPDNLFTTTTTTGQQFSAGACFNQPGLGKRNNKIILHKGPINNNLIMSQSQQQFYNQQGQSTGPIVVVAQGPSGTSHVIQSLNPEEYSDLALTMNHSLHHHHHHQVQNDYNPNIPSGQNTSIIGRHICHQLTTDNNHDRIDASQPTTLSATSRIRQKFISWKEYLFPPRNNIPNNSILNEQHHQQLLNQMSTGIVDDIYCHNNSSNNANNIGSIDNTNYRAQQERRRNRKSRSHKKSNQLLPKNNSFGPQGNFQCSVVTMPGQQSSHNLLSYSSIQTNQLSTSDNRIYYQNQATTPTNTTSANLQQYSTNSQNHQPIKLCQMQFSGPYLVQNARLSQCNNNMSQASYANGNLVQEQFMQTCHTTPSTPHLAHKKDPDEDTDCDSISQISCIQDCHRKDELVVVIVEDNPQNSSSVNDGDERKNLANELASTNETNNPPTTSSNVDEDGEKPTKNPITINNTDDDIREISDESN